MTKKGDKQKYRKENKLAENKSVRRDSIAGWRESSNPVE